MNSEKIGYAVQTDVLRFISGELHTDQYWSANKHIKVLTQGSWPLRGVIQVHDLILRQGRKYEF